MYRILRVLGLLVLTNFIVVLFPSKIYAVNINISSYPSIIDDSIFNVELNISGANDGTNYLRVDLYKDSTSNYFGETYNGKDWYSGSDGLNYFPITIINSTSSAVLQAQVGNPSNTKYSGSGEYKLKIRRYTSSGSQSSNDVQTPVTIQINYQTPSPEPTTTPVLTLTPLPTQTSISTVAPVSTNKPQTTKNPTVKPTPISNDNIEVKQTDLPFYDLTNETSKPTMIPEILGSSDEKKVPFVSYVFIFSGLLFLGYGIYMLYNKNNVNSSK